MGGWMLRKLSGFYQNILSWIKRKFMKQKVLKWQNHFSGKTCCFQKRHTYSYTLLIFRKKPWFTVCLIDSSIQISYLLIQNLWLFLIEFKWRSYFRSLYNVRDKSFSLLKRDYWLFLVAFPSQEKCRPKFWCSIHTLVLGLCNTLKLQIFIASNNIK